MRRRSPLRSLAVLLALAARVVSTEVDDEPRRLFLSGSFFREHKWFQNWHRSIFVGGPFKRVYTPSNNIDLPPGQHLQSEEFLSGLQALRDIVQQAEADGKRLRAYGSKWSLNNIAYTEDYLVESSGLTYIKVGLDEEHVTEAYRETRNRLALVQAGCMVRYVSQELMEHGLALKTSGAGDGQRFAGAVSTGTHGSAISVGSMEDYVKGIHLVIPGEHVFIQRASDPVATEAFAAHLDGARLILDDAMFNAAVVSFGSFGLIHALLIETEPLYRLEEQAKQFDFSEIKDVMFSLENFASLGYDGVVEERPFHFEASINPYKLGDGQGGVFSRIFRKFPIDGNEMESIKTNARSFQPSIPDVDIFGLMEKAFAPSIGILKFGLQFVFGMGLQVALREFYRPIATTIQGSHSIKFPFEHFTSKNDANPMTNAPVPGTSLEVGVPLDRLQDAVDTIVKVVQEHPMPSPLAIRFVKQSNATLAFTKFGPVTATIEMPAPYSYVLFAHVGQTQERIFAALAENDIPHTYHWGQNLPLNDEWVAKNYGSALTEWQEQRLLLLGEVGCNMFSNDLIETLGIHQT